MVSSPKEKGQYAVAILYACVPLTFFKQSAAPKGLRQVRHELHNLIRTIKTEVENQSPSQTFQLFPARVTVSIFERGSSSSSDEHDSPTSDLARAETWSLENDTEHHQSDSPVSIYPELPSLSFDSEGDSDDAAYETDSDDSPPSSVVTTRRSSRSGTTEVGGSAVSARDLERSRKASFLLQGIFKGRPTVGKTHKDLGEFKPLPVPPTLSTNVQAHSSENSSRANSTGERTPRPVSAGSEAEAALAAVKRRSPLSSPKPATRPRLYTNGSEDPQRIPLTVRSPNVYHKRSQSDTAKGADIPFVNSKALPPLPPEAATISFELHPSTLSNTEPDRVVTGYTSTPMSRDNSRESEGSFTTNPTGPSSGLGLSSSLPLLQERSLARSVRSALQSIPTRLLEFGRFGERANITPISPTAPSIEVFDPSRGQGRLQFGQMDPVTLTEARSRAADLQRQVNGANASWDTGLVEGSRFTDNTTPAELP